MRTKDIQADTEIYAVSEHGGPYRHRAIVLDTNRWRARHNYTDGTFRRRLVGYSPEGERPAAFGDTVGLPIVQISGRIHNRRPADEVTNAELRDAAAAAAAALREGGVPTLPAGMTLRLVRPQAVDCTWAEYERREQARRESWQAEQAERRARERAEGEARQRLTAVLGEQAPRHVFQMTWQELERICRAYAAEATNS